MKIKVAAFTERGHELAKMIFASWDADTIEYRDAKLSLEEWSVSAFKEKAALVFIGAMGIAVRAIAGCVKDKLEDPPVIVIDEYGKNVIPVLSGHVGGAIELAKRIALQIDANPVITTATDLNNLFAVDVFARENHLTILDHERIVEVSKRVLKGETIRIATSRKFDPIPQVEFVREDEEADVCIYRSSAEAEDKSGHLRLAEKPIIIGIGCKRGKTFDEIDDAVRSANISYADVFAIASIDVKKDEPGIIEFANRNRIPFLTYSAEELNALSGEFTASEFVEKTVGVDCVCERAAMLAAGESALMISRKQSYGGITLAFAERKL